MPELPELEAYRRRFAPKLADRVVEAVDVNPRKGFLLRSPVQVFTKEPVGRAIKGVWRRGKHLVFDLEGRSGECGHLVVNPMLGGRFQVVPAKEKRRAVMIFALRLDTG